MGVTRQSSQPINGTVINQTNNSHKTLNCITWNIRRGLVTREQDLKVLLKEEDVDIAFITETDTKELRKESDYQISGYSTIFPKRENDCSKIRIIAFVKESIANQVTIRHDLMSKEFPSIWLELNNPIKKYTNLWVLQTVVQ